MVINPMDLLIASFIILSLLIILYIILDHIYSERRAQLSKLREFWEKLRKKLKEMLDSYLQYLSKYGNYMGWGSR